MKNKLVMKTSEKIIRAKNSFIKMEWIGMCISFHYETPILYNRFIAVLFFGAKIIKTEEGYWWNENDRESRIKYFDWMIKIYKFFGK